MWSLGRSQEKSAQATSNGSVRSTFGSPSMDTAGHWEHLYSKRPPEQQGWFTEIPQPSLDWIIAASPDRSARILDAGGGASTLVDHLLASRYDHLTVLDLSGEALAHSRKRLGTAAEAVEWLQGDILTAHLEPGSVDVWHDRAVFHFLHDDEDRVRYKAQALKAMGPDGALILGSFRHGAPPKCSGLLVRHHSSRELASFFGPEMMLEEELLTTHVTPGGIEQDYIFVRLRRQRTYSDTRG